MNKAKVLVFDIETAPMLAYVWARHDQNIAVNQIKNEWFVMAWAAKWLGEPASKVYYADQRKAVDMENDKDILKILWKLLDEADIVITQNGKSFDVPKLNARFIAHGMKPPSSYQHIDTYRILKNAAQFTANSLDYLTTKLCKRYKKLDHKEFPGMELWKACLAGKPRAWDAMRKYNIHDVLATEELYEKIKAWAPQNTPDIYRETINNRQCRTCGKKGQMHAQGYKYTKTTKKPRYQCQKCGSWQLGAK